MPIYSFTCPRGHNHDAIVPFDTAKHSCPECKAEAIRPAIEVPAKPPTMNWNK